MKVVRLQRGDAVELTADFTHYHPALASGARGVVFSRSIRGNGTIMRCRFPEAGRWDIPVRFLALAGQATVAAAETAAAAAPEGDAAPAGGPVYSAAQLVVGPRGGYRSLSYQVAAAGRVETVTLTTRAAIAKGLEELEAAGVAVAQVTES